MFRVLDWPQSDCSTDWPSLARYVSCARLTTEIALPMFRGTDWPWLPCLSYRLTVIVLPIDRDCPTDWSWLSYRLTVIILPIDRDCPTDWLWLLVSALQIARDCPTDWPLRHWPDMFRGRDWHRLTVIALETQIDRDCISSVAHVILLGLARCFYLRRRCPSLNSIKESYAKCRVRRDASFTSSLRVWRDAFPYDVDARLETAQHCHTPSGKLGRWAFYVPAAYYKNTIHQDR